MNDLLIEWKEPAPTRTGGSLKFHRNQAVASLLKANPGRWALVDKNPRTTGTTSTPSSMTGPKWERAFRKETIDGVLYSVLYVRYVG
jgi:hypothetical protein